jgi:hypothetical protein
MDYGRYDEYEEFRQDDDTNVTSGKNDTGLSSTPVENSITLLIDVPVYGSQPGYPNEGIRIPAGTTVRVVNARVAAVSGARPYFTLVECELSGVTHRAAVWPGEYSG